MINFNGLYNKEFFGENLKVENHFSDKKLHFKIIENGTILPWLPRTIDGKWNPAGGIMDDNGRFVKGTFFTHLSGDSYVPDTINYVGYNVVFLGTWSVSWGHCITDSLRWLWFLKSEAYKKYFKHCPIVYAIAGGG